MTSRLLAAETVSQVFDAIGAFPDRIKGVGAAEAVHVIKVCGGWWAFDAKSGGNHPQINGIHFSDFIHMARAIQHPHINDFFSMLLVRKIIQNLNSNPDQYATSYVVAALDRAGEMLAPQVAFRLQRELSASGSVVQRPFRSDISEPIIAGKKQRVIYVRSLIPACADFDPFLAPQPDGALKPLVAAVFDRRRLEDEGFYTATDIVSLVRNQLVTYNVHAGVVCPLCKAGSLAIGMNGVYDNPEVWDRLTGRNT